MHSKHNATLFTGCFRFPFAETYIFKIVEPFIVPAFTSIITVYLHAPMPLRAYPLGP